MLPANRSEFSLLLIGASVCWLIVGAFVLTLTPVPAHTLQLGWSPAFWLLLAPLCALGGLALRQRPASA